MEKPLKKNAKILKIVVYHDSYGCDTGCCGHSIEVYDSSEPSDMAYRDFTFNHKEDYESKEEFAKKAIEKILRQYQPECLETIDWDTLEYEEVQERSPYCE